MDKLRILQEYFGHAQFRPGQEALIDALLAGRDAVGILPTGGGKSLCYQVPALLLPGLALVISPLISLMKDQVNALQAAGISATFLNSSLDGEQSRTVYRGLYNGTYRLLYIAPERLGTEGFQKLAQSLPISLVAVDEAHCISQWGQDFRPSYLEIVHFLQSLPQRPVLAAFTATATEQVRDDIIRLLQLQDPYLLTTGFDRPNLYFAVQRPKSKAAALQTLVQERLGKSGIVYCATRNAVEQVCEALREAGLPATRYHAGLSDAERRQNQDDFLFDRSSIMVATNAFGMGIDKSNVSFVVHYNMPKSLEAYYQEAGRAGRDGEPADCILLYAGTDVNTARFLIENGGDKENLDSAERAKLLAQDFQRLESMVSYCKTTSCLRTHILHYFDKAQTGACGNCANCHEHYYTLDITQTAQMILSCVKRARDHLGYAVGASMIAKILAGGKDKRLIETGLDRLSTYGLLQAVPRTRIRAYIEYLEGEGYLHTEPRHATLALTSAAGEVLFRGEQVLFPEKIEQASETAVIRKPVNEDDPLFAQLKTLRSRLAQAEGVPSYIIFSNATLTDMSAKRPHNQTALLAVSGVGAVKAKRYGAQFLQAIADFEASEEAF